MLSSIYITHGSFLLDRPVSIMTPTKKIRRQYVNPQINFSFSGASETARALKLKGHSRAEVEKALQTLPAYTLHRSARKHYPRRRVFIPTWKHQFCADLIDISKFAKENNGNTFLLTCVDGFSKVADVVPLKKKTMELVSKALASIFKKRGPCKYLQVDSGSEFYNSMVNKLCKENGIKMFSTGSELKAVIVERFNRTLMQRLSRYMTHNKTTKFVNALNAIVKNYNQSHHSGIGMPPNDVNNDTKTKVYLRLYGKPRKFKKSKPLSVGDQVLISKVKKVFDKGYAQSWNKEKFIITRVQDTVPVTYQLQDVEKNNIFGVFYGPELQKVSHS